MGQNMEWFGLYYSDDRHTPEYMLWTYQSSSAHNLVIVLIYLICSSTPLSTMIASNGIFLMSTNTTFAQDWTLKVRPLAVLRSFSSLSGLALRRTDNNISQIILLYVVFQTYPVGNQLCAFASSSECTLSRLWCDNGSSRGRSGYARSHLLVVD